MILHRFVVLAFGLSLGMTGARVIRAAGPPQGQHPEYAQDRNAWVAPPREWKEIQRRGFQEGIEGARKDFNNRRRPDVNNRDEYRHPSLPFALREPYREGFRRGYDQATTHLVGDRDSHLRDHSGADSGPGRRGGDIAEETQRHGFQDGMDGARKDFNNNRRPDVNNREEYRRPSVPYEFQRIYREGFRRGYEKTVAELTNDRRRP